MRLIDGNKLLETYKRWIPQLLSKEDEGDRRGVETCIMVLEDMQTVDAVPVVRCRECKYRGTDDCIFHIKGEPADEELLLKLDNDFCSYGERKEGADNDT